MKSLSILGLVSSTVSAYQDKNLNGVHRVLETRNVQEVMLADMK